jgi:hypothetical protein
MLPTSRICFWTQESTASRLTNPLRGSDRARRRAHVCAQLGIAASATTHRTCDSYRCHHRPHNLTGPSVSAAYCAGQSAAHFWSPICMTTTGGRKLLTIAQWNRTRTPPVVSLTATTTLCFTAVDITGTGPRRCGLRHVGPRWGR